MSAALARYAEAAALANDPSGVMDAVTAAFNGMVARSAAGDDRGVARAAVTVSDGCLRLCAAPATTLADAGNKTRFLAVMTGWAWIRHPALAAVMEAAADAERRAWGDDIDG